MSHQRILAEGKGDKLVDHLRNHLGKLSFVLYVSGIISFGLMFYEGANIDKTYFSDNALLPGLVNREFTIVPSYISNLEKSLEKELNSQTVGSGKMPVSWLMSTLASTGVETYAQNFTFHYPFGSKPVSCSNWFLGCIITKSNFVAEIPWNKCVRDLEGSQSTINRSSRYIHSFPWSSSCS